CSKALIFFIIKLNNFIGIRETNEMDKQTLQCSFVFINKKSRIHANKSGFYRLYFEKIRYYGRDSFAKWCKTFFSSRYYALNARVY
ncbi:hypothetical protein, partial [Bacillus thuringiensis]|uniref:hypothetical protein n=1 Tax=Bacillus thuringiensis TaxID=1428 RepID=UPI001EE0FB6B